MKSKLLSYYRANKKYVMAAVLLTVTAVVVMAAIALRPSGAASSPDFAIVLPQNRSVEDLGGWSRVSPPDSDPVYAFADSIDGVSISVSQQPIPESFKSNLASQIEQLANSYNATTVVNAGDIPVYIGRSSNGPQSVIFSKNDALVLIKSQAAIENESWAVYVSNLADPKSQSIPTF